MAERTGKYILGVVENLGQGLAEKDLVFIMMV